MNPEVLQLVERYDRLSGQLEEKTIRRLDAALDQSFDDLERDFLRSYPAIAANRGLLATQQRAVLMSDLSGVMQVIRPELAGDYERRFSELIQGASGLGADVSGELIRAIAPNSTVRAFAGIPLEAVALQAQEASRRLYRYNEDFQNKASAVIEQSLIQGWGPQRAAGYLREELAITKYSAERITRTETLSALNDSAQMRYKQEGLHVQWVVTRGEVCPFCVARNMQVYEAGKIRVPAHPFCRCILVPWSEEWQKLGLTDDDFTRQYASDRLADLRSQGKEPNYGLTPFERAAKLTSPPTPIWTPSGGAIAPTAPTRSAVFPRVVPPTVVDWESEFVSADVEHAAIFDANGQELLRKSSGSVDAVNFTDAEIATMRGQLMTHNHPLDQRLSRYGSSFSADDITFARRAGLGEIRAVSGDYVYRLRPPADGWSSIDPDALVEAYNRISTEEIAAIRRWRDQQIALGNLADDVALSEMNFRVWHDINLKIANEFGFEYDREMKL